MRRVLLAIALSSAASGSVVQASFPCSKLAQGEYRVFKGLIRLNEASPIPIKIKKGAVILQIRQALLTDWKKPEGQIGAVVPYQQPQLLFRPYRIAGVLRYCAEGQRDDVFGAGDKTVQYLLRCLVDSNADGKYDSFHRYGELVKTDYRTGKTDAPSGVVQSDLPLIKPFALTASGVTQPQNSRFEPAVQSMIKIKELRKNVASLSILTFVSFGISETESSFGRRTEDKILELSLQDGVETMVDGTNFVIARRGSDWTLTPNRGFGGKADLVCGGSVLDAGGTYTIFTGGGMSVVDQQQAEAIK